MATQDTIPTPASSLSPPPPPPPAQGVTANPFRVGSRTTSTPSTPSTNPASGRSSGTDSDLDARSALAPDPVDTAATTGPTLSPGKPLKVGKNVVRDTLRDLVLLASDAVHSALARQPDEQAAELWLANDTEQAGIGDPLADITERRFGVASINNPDVADLIEAGIALGRYAARHLKTAYMLRRARKRLAQSLPDLTEHPTNERVSA